MRSAFCTLPPGPEPAPLAIGTRPTRAISARRSAMFFCPAADNVQRLRQVGRAPAPPSVATSPAAAPPAASVVSRVVQLARVTCRVA
eukprot:7615-Prymnesium_polylepis.1